ncbi:hypothetical protein X961_5851 [Burkholderia pseudomallei MSHR5613]|nr:hypothetical protein X961_5851 [Burkholderia pseudomallei MSHR5613]
MAPHLAPPSNLFVVDVYSHRAFRFVEYCRLSKNDNKRLSIAYSVHGNGVEEPRALFRGPVRQTPEVYRLFDGPLNTRSAAGESRIPQARSVLLRTPPLIRG